VEEEEGESDAESEPVGEIVPEVLTVGLRETSTVALTLYEPVDVGDWLGLLEMLGLAVLERLGVMEALVEGELVGDLLGATEAVSLTLPDVEPEKEGCGDPEVVPVLEVDTLGERDAVTAAVKDTLGRGEADVLVLLLQLGLGKGEPEEVALLDSTEALGERELVLDCEAEPVELDATEGEEVALDDLDMEGVAVVVVLAVLQPEVEGDFVEDVLCVGDAEELGERVVLAVALALAVAVRAADALGGDVRVAVPVSVFVAVAVDERVPDLVAVGVAVAVPLALTVLVELTVEVTEKLRVATLELEARVLREPVAVTEPDAELEGLAVAVADHELLPELPGEPEDEPL
jgi:hypothetical protein